MNVSHLPAVAGRPFRRGVLAALALSLAGLASSARADFASYYIGSDSLATIASGTYAGLPNPNFGRLTFLYAHTYPDSPASNHYHSKGTFRYTGPNLGAETAIELNPSNYLPEGAIAPLTLTPGSGLYGGKLVSAPYSDPSDPGYAFSFLEIRDTSQLAGFAPGSPENILFTSSSNRWSGALTGAHIHLELVSLTPGLNVGGLSALNIGLNAPGDDAHLEDVGAIAFTPVFWTEADAAPGTYVAQFKLVDEDGLFGDSGTFEYRFTAVPEPGVVTLLALGGLFAVVFARRRLAAR